MLRAPVDLLDGVQETIAQLSESYELMILTKGDLFDQEAKIARSGLGEHFGRVEIVCEKNKETYERITKAHRIDPSRFLMVGNSLKSDILPVIAIGGLAVYIPYQTSWIHETVSEEELKPSKYLELKSIRFLPELLDGLRDR